MTVKANACRATSRKSAMGKSKPLDYVWEVIVRFEPYLHYLCEQCIGAIRRTSPGHRIEQFETTSRYGCSRCGEKPGD